MSTHNVLKYACIFHGVKHKGMLKALNNHQYI